MASTNYPFLNISFALSFCSWALQLIFLMTFCGLSFRRFNHPAILSLRYGCLMPIVVPTGNYFNASSYLRSAETWLYKASWKHSPFLSSTKTPRLDVTTGSTIVFSQIIEFLETSLGLRSLIVISFNFDSSFEQILAYETLSPVVCLN